MKLFATLLFVTLVLPSRVQADTPVGDPCHEIPPSATPAQELCLRNACKTFKNAIAACNGDPACLAQANLQYALDVAACLPTAQTPQHEWATIWYADGEYGVAFDLWDVPEHATRFGF